MCNNATQIKDDRTQTHPAIFEGDKRNRLSRRDSDFVAKVATENKIYAKRSRFHLSIQFHACGLNFTPRRLENC